MGTFFKINLYVLVVTRVMIKSNLTYIMNNAGWLIIAFFYCKNWDNIYFRRCLLHKMRSGGGLGLSDFSLKFRYA